LNYQQLLHYAAEARAVYGLGAGEPPLATGNYAPVAVRKFEATDSSFQSALYKDATTGRYRIAIAGTNDLRGDLLADGSLAMQDVSSVARTFSADWHPQMSDALNFAFESIREIKNELLKTERPEDVTLDTIRSRIDVTGHSLGGALAELVSQFFGLPGFNIDGPGVHDLLQSSQYSAMQSVVREEFPDLQAKYALEPGQFVANAFSVVGMAATHAPDVHFAAEPDAAIASPLSIGLSAGGIVEHIESTLGLTPSGPLLQIIDVGSLTRSPELAFNEWSASASNDDRWWQAERPDL